MAEENMKNTEPAEDIEEQETTAEEVPVEAEAAEADSSVEDTVQEEAEEETEEKESRKEAALKEKVAALEDKVMRQMAEFENFRRRTDKEKEQRFSMGEKNVLEKMLPIVDNFERGLQAAPEGENAFAEGMDMIYKQLLKQLEDLGVTPIEAVGKEFDPALHNAVMQIDSEEYETGVVAQEFQKGYMYRDTVLRHSMVGVAK